MTINRFFLPIAAAALSALTPIAAQAAQFVITYRGIVDGNDTTGAFGAPNTSLTGAAFTAIYLLNTATAGSTTLTDGLSFSQILGGTRSNTVSPVSASLTINGFTRAINGLASGEALLVDYDPGAGADVIEHRASDNGDSTTSTTDNYMYHTVNDTTGTFLSSVNWGSSFTYNTNPNDNIAFFQFSTRNNATGLDEEYANGLMNIESVTVASVGAIPEPATWLMMIVGFGMVGASIRSTRRLSSRRQSSGVFTAA